MMPGVLELSVTPDETNRFQSGASVGDSSVSSPSLAAAELSLISSSAWLSSGDT